MIYNNPKILFLTVGMGTKTEEETSLFAPMRKSMQSDSFDCFVLLPSVKTLCNAEHLSDELKDKVFIEPLPHDGDEDNADSCFNHFNQVIKSYKSKFNCSVDNMVIDLTRGTKTMSSAIYSAGLRHGIYQYQYITSKNRTDNGQAESGQEHVNKFNASIATFLTKIDQAKLFLKSFNFGAVESLFENKKSIPNQYKTVANYIVFATQFYNAWHRLDYKKATECCPTFGESVAPAIKELGLESLLISQPIQDWLQELASWKNLTDNKRESYIPTKEECRNKVEQAIKIALDLLANGRRQITIGNYEDAVVRAYRIIEMIGQIYLLQKGYDSARIDKNDTLIQKLAVSAHLQPVGNAYYALSRSNACEFIKLLEPNNNLGKNLLDMMDSAKQNHIMSQYDRNNSILIHGFTIRTRHDARSLCVIFDKIEYQLKSTFTISADDLQTAHTINTFQEIKIAE